jgi:hypothetical protein
MYVKFGEVLDSLHPQARTPEVRRALALCLAKGTFIPTLVGWDKVPTKIVLGKVDHGESNGYLLIPFPVFTKDIGWKTFVRAYLKAVCTSTTEILVVGLARERFSYSPKISYISIREARQIEWISSYLQKNKSVNEKRT